MKENGTIRRSMLLLSFEYSRLSLNRKVYPNLEISNTFSFSFVVVDLRF